MKGSAASSSSNCIPDISIDHENNTMMIRIENPATFEKYIGNYTYEKLPIQFRVLFQSLNQFYSFLNTHIEEKVRAEKGTLYIGVNIVGKEKLFHLPLEQIALTPEEELKKKLWLLENQLSQLENNVLQKENQILNLKDALKGKDKVVEEKERTLFNMSQLINEKDTQIIKLSNLLRHYKNQIQGINDQDYKPSKIQEQQMQESKMTEEFTPIKKNPYNSKAKKIRQMQEYGNKVILRLDQNSKHFNKFKISGNQVEKLHGPTYQIFNKSHLARQGKFYFDIHIKEIKNNNIVVGIITDKNKEEQFSFKKINCVCYNGYDGSICEQQKQKHVNVKPSSGNRIRTVVDMNRSEMEWYIMGGDHRVLIGKALIPASMLKQHVYPYFELYWQGNKVRLNPNP